MFVLIFAGCCNVKSCALRFVACMSIELWEFCAVVDALSGLDFDFTLFSALNVRLNDAKSCA